MKALEPQTRASFLGHSITAVTPLLALEGKTLHSLVFAFKSVSYRNVDINLISLPDARVITVFLTESNDLRLDIVMKYSFDMIRWFCAVQFLSTCKRLRAYLFSHLVIYRSVDSGKSAHRVSLQPHPF